MTFISRKTDELIPYTSNTKPLLVVFIGFTKEQLKTEPNKLFSISLNIHIRELQMLKSEIITELVQKQATVFNKISWCTYEEYIAVADVISSFYTTVCYKNNLYDGLYPYDQTLDDVFAVYKTLYENDDADLPNDQQELLRIVSLFYGKIYFNESNRKYYVTYSRPTDDFRAEILLYDVTKLAQIPYEKKPKTDEDTYVFELTDNEDEFLTFIDRIGRQPIKQVCAFFVDDRKNLPHHYDERLSIIQHYLLKDVSIVLSSKQLLTRSVPRLSVYLKMLKKYWQYDSFRHLKMYRNVQSLGNQTIQVSQAQIIDDIVDQCDVSLQDRTPRDIYVTAPTGAGKSIMFQLPALYLAEKYREQGFLTIVISPLIGLMDDQVKSLKNKKITNAKTINSGISPVEKKRIVDQIQNGEVDILYISTETLLSRSDIEMLIGKRRLGLFIIDEAHIVTTWGKSFRADYWYLGTYLNKLRKRRKFPIVTFTATAIYGGIEDMYKETRDSLNMINPITYFGYVKRDDLLMHIQSSEKDFKKYSHDYRKAKFDIMSKRLHRFERKKEKTLVYFPTVRLLNAYYSDLKFSGDPLADKTARYYGSLDKSEKKENYEAFLYGDAQFMLATKAFGMGIDIQDIVNVYHYAPTGSVIDYIQEIGRAGRDPHRNGNAYFDFLNKDFTEVRRLYGLSTVKKHEIIEVMKKILDVFYTKKNRNLVLSADDFAYIFSRNIISEEDIDNRLKITLLTIEKDFERKMGYSPVVARPRALFASEFVLLSNKGKNLIQKANYSHYFSLVKVLDNNYYAGVYILNIKEIWEKKYSHLSFPQFKYMFFKENDSLRDKKLFQELTPAIKITIDFKNNDESTVRSQFRFFLKVCEKFLRNQAYSGHYFNEYDMGDFLKQKLHLSNKYKARGLANVFLNGMARLTPKSSRNGRCLNIREDERQTSYKVYPNYVNYFVSLEDASIKMFEGEPFYIRVKNGYIFYRRRMPQKDDQDFDNYLVILGLCESIDLLNYEIQGGNHPQIYIRINSVFPMERAVRSPKQYENLVLDEVYKKNKISIAILNYLFKLPRRPEKGNKKEQIMNYTKDFWNEIERYFLGKIPPEVQQEIYKVEYSVN